MLLYKECDRRGRRVLFDSSTIERVPAHKDDKPDISNTEKIPCIVEVSQGYTYIVSDFLFSIILVSLLVLDSYDNIVYS